MHTEVLLHLATTWGRDGADDTGPRPADVTAHCAGTRWQCGAGRTRHLLGTPAIPPLQLTRQNTKLRLEYQPWTWRPEAREQARPCRPTPRIHCCLGPLEETFVLDAATAQFIEAVGQLPPDKPAAVFDHALRLRRSGGREASRALRLSASEFSEIDHAVRSTLLPRADQLNAFRAGLHSDAKAVCCIAARAIRTRAKCTEEHYRVLIEPFAAAGVDTSAQPVAPPP